MIKKKEMIDEVAIETIFDELEQTGEELNKYDYIYWLEKYTEKKESFTSESHIYETDPEIKKNIFTLLWFYEFIKEYAKDNFIEPNKFKYGIYYSIKYNGIGYNIGEQYDCGRNQIFCERTKILDNFIDYSDIENNIEQEGTTTKKEQLKELSNLIQNMVKENVPADAISDTTEKTLKKILSDND